MRKILGGLLSLVALLFLSLAYVELAQAEEPDCEKELATKIAGLVKSDKTNILKLQLRLTTLKLAAETMDVKNKTVEAYVRKQSEVLNNLDKDGVREHLTVLYQQKGVKQTEEAIAKIAEDTNTHLKKGKYFTGQGKYRFKNKDLATYVAAHLLVNKDESPYDSRDAAILWFQSEISEGVKKKVAKSSIAANYVEVSTQVAKLTGVMKGIEGKTPEAIENEIDQLEESIEKEFIRIVTEFKSSFTKSCADLAVCPTCDGAGTLRESSTITAIAQITDEMQSDTKAKSARVSKAIAEMKKEGIKIDLNESEKNVPNIGKANGSDKPAATNTGKSQKTNTNTNKKQDKEGKAEEDKPKEGAKSEKENTECKPGDKCYKTPAVTPVQPLFPGISTGIPGVDVAENPFASPEEIAARKKQQMERINEQKTEHEKKKKLKEEKKKISEENLKKEIETKKIEDKKTAQLRKKISDNYAKNNGKEFLDELKAKTKARREVLPKTQKGPTVEKSVENKPIIETKKAEAKPKIGEKKSEVKTSAKPEEKKKTESTVETKPATGTPSSSEAPTTDVLTIKGYGGDPETLSRGIDPSVMLSLNLGGTEEVGKFAIGDCKVTITIERLPVGYVNHLNFYNIYSKTTEKKNLSPPDVSPGSQIVGAIANRALIDVDIYKTISQHCKTSRKK